MVIEFDFAWLDLQGRGAKGSTLTSHKVDRVVNAPRENGEEDGAKEKNKSIESTAQPVKEKPKASLIEKEKPNTKPSTDKKEDGVPSEDNDPKSQATFEF